MLRPYHLDGDNVKTVTTTCLEQQPLQERERVGTPTTQNVQNYSGTDCPVDMGKFGQTRLDVCGKTTFFQTTGTYRERPTVFEAYIAVRQRTYSLQIVHWKRTTGLLAYDSQWFCHFPAELHPIGSTLLH